MKPNWIWLASGDSTPDTHATFKTKFTSNGSATLKVSCDGIFAAYINGSLALFSVCADYPHYKLYDEATVSTFVGENELSITVWYPSTDSQTYLHSEPGVWFEVSEEGSVIAASGTDTLARVDRNFKQGYCKMITSQLGYSFYYDNTLENTDPYLPAALIEKKTPIKRPQKNLVLDGRIPATYTFFDDHILVDLGREVAGYPDLEFTSPIDQELVIAYGEHLEIGTVSRFIGDRDFSFEFKAKKGKNKWFSPLRRLACRYLEVYFKEPITPEYIGMQHVYYPMTEKGRVFGDDLLQRIYDTSVRTLRLCMHEHYEDCPWREQALYALDSRNQMLFGYYAFKETEYARSNLLLINQGLRPDGLLSICFPAGNDFPIPLFSRAYILEVSEYVKYTGDTTLLAETKNTISTIIDTFSKHKGECGLIHAFPHPFWNFYEWSEGNSNGYQISRKATDPYVEDFDLILNAFYVYVIEIYNKIAGTSFDVEAMREAIKRELYVPERGLYKISVKGTLFGQLGNALAILAGLGTPELAKKVVSCEGLTPATLSMKPFVYDALLSFGDEYKSFILEDIKTVYKRMLDYGATSFWETERGWLDFSKAGSLCHGWSASPAYYLSILTDNKEQ